MNDNVRLNPRVQYVKAGDPESEWKEAKDIHVWYISDVLEDDPQYWDKDTDTMLPHKRQPGVCVAFTLGKKEVSITIPWKNIVHAISDVIKEDDRWKDDQKSWKNLFSQPAVLDLSSTQD